MPKAHLSEEPTPKAWQATAASSMRIALLSQLFVQALSLAAISVQMRLVPRADFAIFGLAVLLVEFPRMLTTMGVGAAVIQKKQIEADELSFLFWLNQAFGVFAMLASVLAVPLLMQPGDAGGLLPVTIALASGSLFAALGRVPQAILERELRTVILARGQWVSMGIASATSIAMGFAGFRVWALVAHQWIELVIFSLILWPSISWRPSWPSWKGYSSALFHYSNAFTLSQWIHWLGQRFDRYWLWRLLAASSVGLEWIGLYTQTMNLILRPALMLTGPLTGILLSSISRTYADKHALDDLLRSVLRLAAVALCPVCFGLMATADESLYLLGGTKWRPAAAILAAMGLMMVARAAINLAVIALSASGKPRLIIGSATAASLTLVVAAVVAPLIAHRFSENADHVALAMAIGQTVATVGFTLLPMLWLCSKALDMPFFSLIQPWLKPVIVSTLMAAVVWGVKQAPVGWEAIPILGRLAVLTFIGAVIYFALMFGDIWWAVSFLRRGRFAGQNSVTL